MVVSPSTARSIAAEPTGSKVLERVPGGRRGNRPLLANIPQRHALRGPAGAHPTGLNTWSGSPAQSCALPKAVGPRTRAGSNPPAHSQKMRTTPLMGVVLICSWSGIRTRDLTIMSRALSPTELPSHEPRKSRCEPRARFELATPSLPWKCSTTELSGRCR
jgi:hypothetical protein